MTDTTITPAATEVGKAQHFTDSQSQLIAKLRKQLPSIVREAEEASELPVSSSIWGVPLVPTPEAAADSHDLRVDVILNKFIKARNNDVELAANMLKSTLMWRAEFRVDGILEEEFPEDVFGQVGYVYGHDGEGRPVTYNTYGNLDNALVFGDLIRFLRWRVQLHERGMRKLDFVDVADMVQVHDYDGVGLFSYDKDAKAASRATIQLMSDNYPETLAVKIFANVPGWGETIFNIVCLWLSEETKQKFVVVSKANTPRVLAERIGLDNIPAKFVAGKSESLVDEVNSAPEPQTAHENPAENQPEPTDTITDADSKQTHQLPPGDTGRISLSASSPPLPSPPQPAVTPAPASPSSNPEDLEDITAGMRIDDKTENQEPEATAAPMP